MINEEKTLENFGYNTESLAPTSFKKVIWNCDGCGVEKVYTFNYVNNKKKNKNLCAKCCHAHRKGKSSNKPKQKTPALPLPDYGVNREKTMELFGYDPIEHFNSENQGPFSRDKIVINCYYCGRESSPKRSNLNTAKYMTSSFELSPDGQLIKLSETKPKCRGCYTRDRKKGKRDSEETRVKKMRSQQKRRVMEKENPDWLEQDWNNPITDIGQVVDENYGLSNRENPREISQKKDNDYVDYSNEYPWSSISTKKPQKKDKERD